MPDTAKEKKLRLYKFATEYNLSTESLVEFLQKKGFEVKSHMSLLNDEMVSEIKAFFKKDIEKAEKHYKKISDFQKKRAEHDEPEVHPEPAPKVVEEKPVEKIVEEVIPEPVEEKTEQTATAEEPAPAPVPVPEVIEEPAPKVEAPAEPKKPFRTETEIALEGRKKGLTIIGKVDLKQKREKAESKEADGTAKPAATTSE
ncbi:MAG: translation initiation factor IF-2 N-terminal domain-containing protein, partial [Melioribacteraceae bacterium]